VESNNDINSLHLKRPGMMDSIVTAAAAARVTASLIAAVIAYMWAAG
jgi:hypothetical protein